MHDTRADHQIIQDLSAISGKKYLITNKEKMQGYCKGFRLGGGDALAVIRPATLLEMWQALNVCWKANLAVIMQAANTGLTGGSTPDGNNYDRPLVIINTMRVSEIQLIDNAKQIVGLAGSTLFGLEKVLAPYGREPHSVIGSSCIGASIVGGVCNNSGGALIRRGPAYTELSLFAQVNEDDELVLVNNLGIQLGDSPEEILTNLQTKNYSAGDIDFPKKRASDDEYEQRVRDVDADTPSRFNSDARRLHEASGCAGKVAVFAVRLDTYPVAKKRQVFYLAANEAATLTKIRRDVLSNFIHLPVSGEYLHRDCYDLSKQYGKDMFFVIDTFGPNVIPKLFALKRTVDRFAEKIVLLPSKISDRIMQFLSKFIPNYLPEKMEAYRDKYQHHWILETEDEGVEEMRNYLLDLFGTHEGAFFECTKREGEKALLHRFVIGGAVGRSHLINEHKYGALMTCDVAFPRNERGWFEELPSELNEKIAKKWYYGHLFCHVMHQNYLLKKGVDAQEVKQKILDGFDERGAEYPAEHNVGHEYHAKESLVSFYKKIDPTNSFNPGIGKTSKCKHWH